MNVFIMRSWSIRPQQVHILSKITTPSLSRPTTRLVRSNILTRCYSKSKPASSAAPAPSTPRSTPQQTAKAASQSSQTHAIAERLLIYHSGTGRTTFLAMIKITSLFIGAFFAFIAIPSAVKSDQPPEAIAKAALCGIIPIAFITYTTSPFVTHAHIHLPSAARASRAALERFVQNIPPSTQLTLTTMSFISKPRYSSVKAGDLFPVSRRFGIINYARDTAVENEARKWYNYRAVKGFHIQDKSAPAPKRYQSKKKTDLVEGWIWQAIKDRIQSRAA